MSKRRCHGTVTLSAARLAVVQVINELLRLGAVDAALLPIAT